MPNLQERAAELGLLLARGKMSSDNTIVSQFVIDFIASTLPPEEKIVLLTAANLVAQIVAVDVSAAHLLLVHIKTVLAPIAHQKVFTLLKQREAGQESLAMVITSKVSLQNDVTLFKRGYALLEVYWELLNILVAQGVRPDDMLDYLSDESLPPTTGVNIWHGLWVLHRADLAITLFNTLLARGASPRAIFTFFVTGSRKNTTLVRIDMLQSCCRAVMTIDHLRRISTHALVINDKNKSALQSILTPEDHQSLFDNLLLCLELHGIQQDHLAQYYFNRSLALATISMVQLLDYLLRELPIDYCFPLLAQHQARLCDHIFALPEGEQKAVLEAALTPKRSLRRYLTEYRSATQDKQSPSLLYQAQPTLMQRLLDRYAELNSVATTETVAAKPTAVAPPGSS